MAEEPVHAKRGGDTRVRCGVRCVTSERVPEVER